MSGLVPTGAARLEPWPHVHELDASDRIIAFAAGAAGSRGADAPWPDPDLLLTCEVHVRSIARSFPRFRILRYCGYVRTSSSGPVAPTDGWWTLMYDE